MRAIITIFVFSFFTQQFLTTDKMLGLSWPSQLPDFHIYN